MGITIAGSELESLLNGDAHMATVTALATISFIFADAALEANACIPASSTGALTIAALLALAASLAARFGRQVFFICRKLEVGRRTQSLSR